MFSPPPCRTNKDYVLNEYSAYEREAVELPLSHLEARREIEAYEGCRIPSEEAIMNKILKTRFLEDVPQEEYKKMLTVMDALISTSPYLHLQRDTLRDRVKKGIRESIEGVKSYVMDAHARAGDIRVATERSREFFRSVVEEIREGHQRFLDWLYTASDPPRGQSREWVAAGEVPRLANPPFVIDVPSSRADLKPPPPEFARSRPTAMEYVRGADLTAHTALVTGGYSGIGAEVSRALASAGAQLVLPCRDSARCDVFASALRNEFSNPHVYCEFVDLGEISTILPFWNRLVSSELVPNIVIHCAATLHPALPLKAHGNLVDRTIGVNYLGPALLNEYLLPLVSTAKQGPRRIINVTDSRHRWASLNLCDITPSTLSSGFSGLHAYHLSKLGNIINAQYLANKIHLYSPNRVTANAIDPGLTSNTHLYDRSVLPRLSLSIRSLFHTQSPSQAAAPILRLALDPLLNDVSGHYFEGFHDSLPSPLALSRDFRDLFLRSTSLLLNRILVIWADRLHLQHVKSVDHSHLLASAPQDPLYALQQRAFSLHLQNLTHLEPPPRPSPYSEELLAPATKPEYIGGRPLGVGTDDAPLIGDVLSSIIHEVPDTHPLQIQELKRRQRLTVPDTLTPEQRAQLALHSKLSHDEFNLLKSKILQERALRRHSSTPPDHLSPPPHSNLWTRLKTLASNFGTL